MTTTAPKLPKKGAGETLRRTYEENRKKSKPSPELLEILKNQKIEDEKSKDKKIAKPPKLGKKGALKEVSQKLAELRKKPLSKKIFDIVQENYGSIGSANC